jgi:hypothetical protein
MGRPTKFTAETATEICRRLAEGESLKAICKDEAMPAERTVFGWLAADDDFSQQYARARKHWAEAQLEEIIEIADDNDLKPEDKRVRIDTRKWAMGKLNGKYSDKLKHVGGDEDDAPIRSVTGIEWTIVQPPA